MDSRNYFRSSYKVMWQESMDSCRIPLGESKWILALCCKFLTLPWCSWVKTRRALSNIVIVQCHKESIHVALHHRPTARQGDRTCGEHCYYFTSTLFDWFTFYPIWKNSVGLQIQIQTLFLRTFGTLLLHTGFLCTCQNNLDQILIHTSFFFLFFFHSFVIQLFLFIFQAL